MSLLYGPGELVNIDWRSRIEHYIREIASNGPGGGSSADSRLDKLADMLAELQAIEVDTATITSSLASIFSSIEATKTLVDSINNNVDQVRDHASAIELKQDDIIARLDSSIALLTDLLNELRAISGRVNSHFRKYYDANSHPFGSALEIPDNPARSKCRITNNIGDGTQFPPRETAWLYVGFVDQPDLVDFDQVIPPGESVLVDWPQSRIWIAAFNHSSFSGYFTVAEYYL